MIPVTAQPEPADFDAKVRKKGLAYLNKKGILLDQPLPEKTAIEPYWCHCLTDLHQAYGGVCAYLGVFFERVMGASSVDHFIAKSTLAGQAYEWSNYRLACSTMNSRKREYNDVLDPFFLAPNSFWLQLSTGHIYPNPHLAAQPRRIVEQTIERLGLDDPACRELRARLYQEYLEYQLPSVYLKKLSPFIWCEANRQGLL
ncbi:hypothetical protein BXU06_07305 [Aquaspirillum sp. LM1]|nr:hypothetical protein BXU06_07305 [Aquaspirillum sp. LM1]